ncbi:HK97 family phage prohead protease [Yunchengibacter salinarum]|uniref:HK97 family phage prohead protease n=1 Tax=Yunchengibacter salinarum TaxID=3133399 RepID=UPI0035B622BF
MHDQEMRMAPYETMDLALSLETRARDDGARCFEGYGAVFDRQDRDGDIIRPGAFSHSLKTGLPKLLWQHNMRDPIGRFDRVAEDAHGLGVQGRLARSGRGAEAWDLLCMGALDGLSVGFITREAERDSETGARCIIRADLMEISLVTFPANDLARVAALKAAHMAPPADGADAVPTDPRGLERILRQAGFSRRQARAVTAKGARGLVDMPDRDGTALAGLTDRLRTERDTLRRRIFQG